MNKKEPEETSQPPFLPTVSPEEIIDLLKVQRAKGEELLKNRSLSSGDLLYWNLFTKEILTNAELSRAPVPILVAGPDNVRGPHPLAL